MRKNLSIDEIKARKKEYNRRWRKKNPEKYKEILRRSFKKCYLKRKLKGLPIGDDLIKNPLILNNKIEYNAWRNMKQRCNNKNHPSYKNYGNRGIDVCERWQTFDNFIKDIGKKPEGLTIERINNDKGYSPDNCKWATYKEQNNNQRPKKHNKFFFDIKMKKGIRLFLKKRPKWIYCHEDDKLFENQVKAAKYYGVTRAHVSYQVKMSSIVCGKKLIKYVDF